MKGIFVVGAGPAGLFAALQIALAGYDVFLFNRDIKPGGLAEYGIYPTKDKMKSGLRKQFAKVLDLPNVHYFGNVRVGNSYDVTIEETGGDVPGGDHLCLRRASQRETGTALARMRRASMRPRILFITTIACRPMRRWIFRRVSGS